MRDEIINAFKLVVDNAEILKSYSFNKGNKKIQMVWTWHQDKPDELQIEDPGREKVAAFILTFRQFIQANDRCSFKYLADHALNDPDVSEGWKTEFIKLREKLNKFLDVHPSFMPVQFSDEPMVSNREILNTYISGLYAHSEEHKQELLEKWRDKHKLLQGMFDTHFLQTVIQVYGYIVELSKLCKKELEK